MRKDLKVGLTIGAILVVTLIVYLIVLSRGPAASNSRIALNPQKSGDAAPALADGSSPAATGADGQTPGYTPAAAPGDQDKPAAPSVAATDAHAPATQPAKLADRADWNAALNNGLPLSMSAAAPERTQTPMIDGPTAAASIGSVSRAPGQPMIDSVPATQPALSVAAPRTATAVAPVTIDPVDSASLPTAVQPPTIGGQRTHRVAAGETPSSIAKAIYGNSKYYSKILAANPGVDPKRLKIGQILIIPDLADVQKNASSPAAATDAAASVDPSSAYQVAPGDTLEKIARKLYGNIAMADKLYQLNKGLIGANENVLKIGWVLKLPAAPTVASAAH